MPVEQPATVVRVAQEDADRAARVGVAELVGEFVRGGRLVHPAERIHGSSGGLACKQNLCNSCVVAGIVDRDEIASQVTAKLIATHPEYDRDEVDRIVEEELSAIEHSPVQDFLLVLTERAAKKRLKRGAKRD